jgi:hypothetical protein
MRCDAMRGDGLGRVTCSERPPAMPRSRPVRWPTGRPAILGLTGPHGDGSNSFSHSLVRVLSARSCTYTIAPFFLWLRVLGSSFPWYPSYLLLPP